jgi:thioredoxin-like negative regulator of GroEL
MSYELTSVDDLREFMSLSNRTYVLLHFKASWCKFCSKIEPFVDSLANRNIYVVKIDVDTFDQLSKTYNIKSLPTFVLIRNGKIVDTYIGSSTTKITELLNKYL